MDTTNDLAASIAKLPTPTIPSDPSLATCPKCAGSRKYVTRSRHTGRLSYTGKCFGCDGTGTVDRAELERSYAAGVRTSMAIHTIEAVVLEAVHRGDEGRAEFYLQRVVREEMFYVGKRNARKILDAIASGRWHDDCSTSETWGDRGAIDAGEAARWRDRAIEIGREIRALSEKIS